MNLTNKTKIDNTGQDPDPVDVNDDKKDYQSSN